MGAGERTTRNALLCKTKDQRSCSYVLFGKANRGYIDEENGYCSQGNGQQPFLLIQLPSRKFAGAFLHNSNGRQIYIDRNGNSLKINQKMTGGIFDLYLFYSDTAELIVQKYHNLIGKPYLPPMWSLGYHQSRYGWRNIAKVKEVVGKFEENDIPLDVIWSDIDYMKDLVDFTIDSERYKNLGSYVNELHSKKIQWVPVIHSAIKFDPNDKYYKLGKEHDSFIKSASDEGSVSGKGTPLVKKSWPGPSVFLSWYSSYSYELWNIGLKDLYNQAQFDGIWLEMNEIETFLPDKLSQNFENEEILMNNPHKYSLEVDAHDSKEFDDLVFRPGGCFLNDTTIPMTGYHPYNNDFEEKTRKEFNTHSIWSLYEAKATYEFQAETLKTRPFVLTRSNFPGSGMYASKKLGDNHSSWNDLIYSIGGIYSFQLFGMPLVGADICGVIGNSWKELCGRWQQLGAFTPFSRNHNDIHYNDQEPYVFGKEVITATKNAIRQKYSIAMYYYTKLFEVSLNGGTLIRPLFFEFPDDLGTYDKTDFMFMIGSALLIPPTLHEGKDFTLPYCTNEDWYNLKDFTKVCDYDQNAHSGKEIKLQSEFDYVNVMMRGGSIIPYQDALGLKIRRIRDLPEVPMELIIAPDHTGKASGNLITDDGISLGTIENKAYRHLEFNFNKNDHKLSVNVVNSWESSPTKSEMVTSILIFGAGDWKDIKDLCVNTNQGKYGMQGIFDKNRNFLNFTQSSKEIYWKDVTVVEFGKAC